MTPSTRSGSDPVAGGRSRWRPYLIALVLYQALSLVAWAHLVAGGFGGTLPSGSGDPGQEVWFLGWFEHALATGTDPFLSHAVFAPAGVNLLSNTSCDLLGLLFAPVTAVAGPVASFDVATLLAPALSALAAMTLCRRYVSWSPAAFVGGLLFGFGPFLATDLRYGHLDLTWLVFAPLIWCCLDALLLRGTRRPVPVGVALGALVVAQFFVSTEMLAVTVLVSAAALVLAALRHPPLVAARLQAAGPGLAVGLGLPILLLAYPVWVVTHGPRHVSGPVWPHVGAIATSLASTVQPHGELAGVAFISGGNGGYLGVGLLVVLVAAVVWCRDRAAVQLAAVTAVVAWVLSLGYRLHAHDAALAVPLPAAVLGHLPLLDSLVPARFAAAVLLCAGLILAVAATRLRAQWQPGRVWVPVVGVALLAVALGPLVPLPAWPYPVRHVPAVPMALRLKGTVVVYPDASGAASDQMIWQADDGFRFALADGYAIVPGPDNRAVEAPEVDALWLVLAAGSVGTLPGRLSPTTVRSVRSSLRQLGASRVVVLPGARGSAGIRRAMTQVLGPPSTVAGAAVWPLFPDLLGRAP